MTDWFAPRRIADGVWRVAEPGHVNCWLVAGSERAVLVDSGLGIFDIRAACERLTDLPVEVANTHAHFDHIGGDRYFDRVSIHEAGERQLARGVDPAMLLEYAAMIPGWQEGFEAFVREDGETGAHSLTPDEHLRALPAGFDPGSWRIPPVQASRTLADGDLLELGDRTLRVIHTPGHTPDSACFLLEDVGILFTGDTVTSGAIWAHQVEGDVDAFTRSTASLAEMEGRVSLLCMGHHLRSIAEPAFLAEVAELFAEVNAGRLTGVAALDDFGDPALLVERGRAMAFFPDPGRERRGTYDGWEF